MAGSNRWFGYEADNGDIFAFEGDESTHESVNLGSVAITATTPPLPSKGRLDPRKVACYRIADDQTIRQQFLVKTPAALNALFASGLVTVGGVQWRVSSTLGEKRKAIPQTDTEQLDGDIDNNYGGA